MKTVSDVIKKLMQKNPYYGFFAIGLNKEFNDSIPTLAVQRDGINNKLLINRNFWLNQTPNQRYGSIMHELLHIILYHLLDFDDWMKKAHGNHQILNIAMDLEVQSYVWQEGEDYLTPGVIADTFFRKYPDLPKYAGTNFYIDFLEKLKAAKEKQQQEQGGNQPGGNKQGTTKNNSDGGSKPQDNSGNSPGEQKIGNRDQTLDDITKKDYSGADQLENAPEHKWTTSELSDAIKKLMKSQLDWQIVEAAKQTLKEKGNLPGCLKEKLEKLMKPKPPVFNWKSYFRRFLGFTPDIYMKRTKRKESKRFSDAYGMNHKKKHNILVAVDTSGSISDPEYKEFFDEINYIWKAGANVHIIECDCTINKEYDYNGEYPEMAFGGGGTSFLPCVDYYNQHWKNYNTMVYFTDGCGDQENCKPLRKILWVISSNGAQNSEYPGVKINIPKKEEE